MHPTIKLLKSFSNIHVMEIPSGCCGMAGSFGYESEHREFSKKIGELTLLPYIRNLAQDIPIIANGYSCRTQVKLHTTHHPLHLAEWLAQTIETEAIETEACHVSR